MKEKRHEKRKAVPVGRTRHRERGKLFRVERSETI